MLRITIHYDSDLNPKESTLIHEARIWYNEENTHYEYSMSEDTFINPFLAPIKREGSVERLKKADKSAWQLVKFMIQDAYGEPRNGQ